MEPEEAQQHTKQFDIIVIGGGIIGCGIAREARLRGISVALFEKGDFASGTSGKTSSLIHGGIRYLEQGAFSLVRESLEERYKLLHLAPHLVSPLPFLFPIYEGRSRRKLSVQMGMALYHYFAGEKSVGPHRFLSPAQVRFMEPNLSPQGLRGAALFSDCQMDDTRLCLSVLQSAKKLGVKVFNYTEVISLIKHGRKVCGVRVREVASGNEYDVEGGVIINSAGAWSDTICQMEGPLSQRHIRPTKGIHLVLPKITEKHAVVLSGREKERIFFVMPWREHSLIGTTDTDYQGDPNRIVSDEDEVKSLLSETAAFFPVVAQEKVLARFAALRPLSYSRTKNPLLRSRKERIEWTSGKMLVVSGGKFTLFRKIGERVVDAILKTYPRLPALKRPAIEPLLHGAPTVPLNIYIRQECARKSQVSAELMGHLIRAYGTNYQAVLDCANEDPRLLKPITALGYPILAEVIYAVQKEQAVHLGDFMLRRTRMAHGPYRNSLRLIQTIVKTMGSELGWSAEQMLNEFQSYIAETAE
jgi:glycerol-3-phosphate dehydrogenase